MNDAPNEGAVSIMSCTSLFGSGSRLTCGGRKASPCVKNGHDRPALKLYAIALFSDTIARELEARYKLMRRISGALISAVTCALPFQPFITS